VQAIVAGDMPGWQIAFIAARAAIVAAAVAVLLDRAWTGSTPRRTQQGRNLAGTGHAPLHALYHRVPVHALPHRRLS
jgi:hypothetical protein